MSNKTDSKTENSQPPLPMNQDNSAKLIDKLGKIIDDSDRMILILPPDGSIEVHTTYFTLYNLQRLTHLLQRTPHIEWWLKPVSSEMIKLRIIFI